MVLVNWLMKEQSLIALKNCFPAFNLPSIPQMKAFVSKQVIEGVILKMDRFNPISPAS